MYGASTLFDQPSFLTLYFHNNIQKDNLISYSEPPSVENARVDIAYEFNHVAQDWVLIAKYSCGLGYQYANSTVTYLYCKDYKWIGPEQPSCVNAGKVFTVFIHCAFSLYIWYYIQWNSIFNMQFIHDK